MLDEQALRKPGFTEGRAIKLADGQEWMFPKPRFRFYPVVGQDGTVTVEGGSTYGSDHDKLIDALAGGEEVEDFERLRLQFSGAVSLLSRNYSLAPEDYSSILCLDTEDEASGEMWTAINRVMLGLPAEDESPKP